MEDPWKSLIEERSRSVAAKLGQPTPPAPTQPPASASRELPADVSDMTPAQRQAFIEQMVDGLALRLKSNGKDLEGWMRLVRAYSVLGRTQDASTALASARSNFADDPKALGELKALADTLGIRS
jgi:cytochrome c-type biogenesis protein CcmH